MEKLSGASAPLLKSIVLAKSIISYNQSTLEPDLFGGGTPALTYMSIVEWSITAFPVIMKGLTTLRLEDNDLAKTPNGDLHLFEALEEMPNLRNLTLDIRRAFLGIPRNDCSVMLPNLQTFSFTGSLHAFPSFLGRLSLPSAASLIISLRPNPHYVYSHEYDPSIDFLELACSLESSWLSTNSRSLRCVQARTSEESYNKLVLCGWLDECDPGRLSGIPDDLDGVCERVDKTLVEHADLRIDFGGTPPYSTIRHVLEKFPLQGLTCIHLDVSLRKKDCALLARLPVLQSVSLTQASFAEFCNYMSRDPVLLKYHSKEWRKLMKKYVREGMRLPPPKYFPELKCLAIKDGDFGLFDYTLENIEDEAIDMEIFIESLTFRKKHSAPIRRLVLHHCYNVTDGEVDLMSEAVEGEVHKPEGQAKCACRGERTWLNTYVRT
ncbi:hypothetical protein CVT24_004407 [Panaeolus cyanescens]|uniref:F-box domain-containing protein n=1 Tax=Panaeolus cyanescens TaxID=181874 RepID=A0A409YBK7_9AGAR|nr:hypothetical protein CVT24_004407 [Panaeolus cyanescens]